MNVQPVNEDECELRNVWPVGWYPCTIAAAEEKVSGNGNGFFRCEVQVFSESGLVRRVMANIMDTGNAAFQLREAAEALDLLEKYRAGQPEAADLVGRSAYCKLAGQYEQTDIVRSRRKEAPKGKATAHSEPPATGRR